MPDAFGHAVGDNVPRWLRSSKSAMLDMYLDPAKYGPNAIGRSF